MRRFEENSPFVIDGFAEIWDSSGVKKLCIQGRFPSEARLFMETLSQIAIKRGFCCKGRLVYFTKSHTCLRFEGCYSFFSTV